jgi:hypothetical protein
MADVVLVSIVPTPSLLHHNDVRITYPTIFNLRTIRFVPLYYMAMPQSMVTITKAPFVTTLVHIVVSMKFKLKTPKETQLPNVHTKMPKEVDKIFVGQPLDLGGGGLDPLRPPGLPKPLRYFGLPMMNPIRPPLPPNKPYIDH